MYQRLKNRDIAPPDFFTYVHRETSHRTNAPDYYTWIERINAHRKANELPAISAAEAEDQLCKTLPPEWCSYSDNTTRGAWVNTRLSIGDVADAMKAFASFAAGGFEFVPRDEAERRARICTSCYNNVNVQGCGACRQILGFVTEIVAQRKTQLDSALKTCANCRCVNSVQVHFPMSALKAKTTPEMEARWPDFCWQNAESENYVA